MPTINTGDYRGSEGNLGPNSGIIKRDVISDKIFYLEPEVAPLTMLLKKAPRRKARSFKLEWFEKERMPTVDQINNSGGYTAGATSIIVDNGAYVAVNDLIKIQNTSEVLHVTAVSTNTLTVVRSWGGTAAAAIDDNDYYTILGPSALEGASAELGKAVESVTKHNFTQIFRDPFGITNTQNAIDLYGGKDITNLEFERGMDHKVSIELSCFFGERNSDTSGDEPRRSMGGFQEFISTSSTNFGGVVSYEDIVNAAQTDFHYGSDVKWLFAARAVASNVSLVAKDSLRTAPPAETYGVRMNRVITQHGDYVLMKQRIFEGDDYAKIAFVIDPENVEYAYLRDTRLVKNIQGTSDDAMKEEWLTECSLVRKFEQSHGLWTQAA